jgi:hypothetical protein
MPGDKRRYLGELARFVRDNLSESSAVVAALSAVLTDPAAYSSTRGLPSRVLVDFVQELVLTERWLERYLSDPNVPISRELINDKWCAVWRGARSTTLKPTSFEFDVCISFAGDDRAVAERIAELILSTGMNRRVFYDEFEKVALWGEPLFNYLYEVYSKRSRFCLILFSHRYRKRAWTRHELRAAQARVLTEHEAYVLPVALDEGAVPDEYASVGYWSFAPGDEERIASATEEKINSYLTQHYFPIEEIAEIINRDLVAGAILDGYREGILARRASGDAPGAQALTAVALIAAAGAEHLEKPVRSLVDLVVFAEGAVSDLFDDKGNAVVFGQARIKRWLGLEEPVMLAVETWLAHLAPYQERWNSLGSDADES